MTKLLLANYLNIICDGREDITTYDEMHTKMFFSDVQVKGLDPSSESGKGRILQKYTPYRHLIHTHSHGSKMKLYIRLNRGARYILLYRNPLDNLISSYFYHFKYRPELAEQYKHPREIIDWKLPVFIKQYNYQKAMSERNVNAVQVSYESLYQDKANTFAGILEFLGIPVKEDAVELAVDFSSLKSVRAQEQKRNKAIHQEIQGFKGSFVRSGKIGQWKEFFNDEDVENVSRKLAAHSISLDEFIIE